MENILERFLRYVAMDTQSCEESESQPSGTKQLELLELLKDELIAMGIPAQLDEFGYVMGRIPSNCGKDIPAVGFIAHVDTSPDASGADIKPQIIRNYDGSDILLKGSGAELRPCDFPEMLGYKGQTLITTDGTTLLGADDKAGIAEIMDAAQYIVNHPEFKHGDICIAFTPDEEIGRGTVGFDVGKFGAKYAYTMDGGALGELEYENFNAASASVQIRGRNIHPGYAKGKMKNAMRIAMELNSLLPAEQKPEYTEGYEGFFHLIGINGTVEECSLEYIIRDHDSKLFEHKKAEMTRCCEFLEGKYGAGTVKLTVRHQYSNMRKEIEPHMKIVDIARKAMENEGIQPKVQPIRGGTDGANLSYMGLPCPNLFAGGHNFHGKLEYLPLESMKKARDVIIGIIRLFALE